MRSPLRRARRGMALARLCAASLAVGCGDTSEPPNAEDIVLSDEEAAQLAPPEVLGDFAEQVAEERVEPALPTPSREDMQFDEDDAWMAKGLVRTALPHAKIYNWVAESTDTVMDPVSTHVCFLTRVSGNLGGNSRLVLHRNSLDINLGGRNLNLIKDDLSPNWKLSGYQWVENSLIGEATCVPRADFKVNPGGFTSISTRGWLEYPPSWPSCSSSGTVNMWAGHSITYLAGVGGKFEGGGEYAEVQQSFHEGTASKLKVARGGCAKQVDGYAYSFFVGILGHANHPTYLHSEPPYVAWFANSNVTPNGGNEMKLSASNDKTVRQRLIKTNNGVCYLTRISGNFDGGGERLRIYPEKDSSGTEWWWFEAKAEGGSAYGSARCILYDQRMTAAVLY